MSYKMMLYRFSPSRELFRMPANAVSRIHSTAKVRGYIRIRKLGPARFAIGDGRETFRMAA
jgi:hypothetical protein